MHIERTSGPEDIEWDDCWSVLALPVLTILCFFSSVMGHRQPQRLSLPLRFPLPVRPVQYRGTALSAGSLDLRGRTTSASPLGPSSPG